MQLMFGQILKHLKNKPIFQHQKTLNNIWKYQIRDSESLLTDKKQYKYDLNNKDDTLPPKKYGFQPKLKKTVLKYQEKQQFLEYQQTVEERAKKELEGSLNQSVKIEEDELWGQNVPQKPIDIITNKELTWKSRTPNYFEKADHQIFYLTEFQKPYILHQAEIMETFENIVKQCQTKNINIHNPDPNFSIEEHYQNDKEINSLFEQLYNQAQHINYKLLPNFGLKLRFELRYKQDFAKIWKIFNQELEKNIHHYTIIELAKIRYAGCGSYPQTLTLKLKNALIHIIKSELHLCNITELLHLAHAFRNMSTQKIQTKIMNEILSKLKEVDSPDQYAYILYTYANSRLRPSNYVTKKFDKIAYDQEETKKVVNTIFEPLFSNIPAMSLDALSLLSKSFFILQLEGYQDIMIRIERGIMKQQQSLKPYHVSQILYVFGKVFNGKPFGSEQLYQNLYVLALKHWQTFDNLDRSRILFTLVNRKFLNVETFNKDFLPWIQENISLFSYAELSNVGSALMYLDIQQKDIWKKFIINVANQELAVPFINYQTLKFVRYYVDSLYPDWNYLPYEQQCREAENFFNILRFKNKYYEDQAFIDLGQLLVKECQIQPIILLEYDNLILVDYAIMPQKVAIMIQSETSTIPMTNLSLPIYDLKCKILEQNGWGVIKINWEEFRNQHENKVQWLKSQIASIFSKQDQSYQDSKADRFDKLLSDIVQMQNKHYTKTELKKQEQNQLESQKNSSNDTLTTTTNKKESTQKQAPTKQTAAQPAPGKKENKQKEATKK